MAIRETICLELSRLNFRLEALANVSVGNKPYCSRSANTVENNGGSGVNAVITGTFFNGMVVDERLLRRVRQGRSGPVIKAMLAVMKRALEDGELHFYRVPTSCLPPFSTALA